MSRPALRVDISRTYRPIFEDWDQAMSPLQIDPSMPRNMRVSAHYSHPFELEAADPANLAGFAGSPISPSSIASLQIQLSDWIEADLFGFEAEAAIPQRSKLIANPGLTDIGGFDPEFFFDYPSEVAFSPAPGGAFVSNSDPLLRPASAESPMVGLIGNPFMGPALGSVYDEYFPVSRPPVQPPMLSHPRPRPIPTAVHNLIETESLVFSHTFVDFLDSPENASDIDFSIPLQQPQCPNVEDFMSAFPDPEPAYDERDGGDEPDFSIPLQRPDWPNVNDFTSAFLVVPPAYIESDIADGPDCSLPSQRLNLPTGHDVTSAFPAPSPAYVASEFSGTPFSPQNPVHNQPKPGGLHHTKRWLIEGVARQQAAARPTRQASLERRTRIREEGRAIREDRADRAKEKMANLQRLGRSRAQARPPCPETPQFATQRYVTPPPRGPPPPLPPRHHSWQLRPLAREHPQAVKHCLVPSQHLHLMPKANKWQVGFRLPVHNDKRVVPKYWFQAIDPATGDVLGYQPQDAIPPSLGAIPKPPAVTKQAPPQQRRLALPSPARLPRSIKTKRPAEPSKGSAKKIVVIDGVPYQRL